MKFTIDIEPKKHPNECGELLRERFFQHNPKKGIFGGSSNFDLNEGIKELESEPTEFDEEEQWHCVVDQEGIKLKWHCDGDTTLQFHFSDGSVLLNNDAKKTYRWEYYNAKQWQDVLKLYKLDMEFMT